MAETAEVLNASVIASNKLRDFVDRIERLEQEKANYAEDIKAVYKDVKNAGLDTATVKRIVKLRKMDEEDVLAQEQLLDLYKTALGM